MSAPKKEVIFTDKAPLPIKPSPFCQAVKYNGLVFCSGNIGMDPVTEKLVEGDVGERTRQALKNIGAILEAAGSSLQNIIKANVYLANMDDFAAMNKAYLGFFPEYVPARTCVAVNTLPLGTDVEIECTAHL